MRNTLASLLAFFSFTLCALAWAVELPVEGLQLAEVTINSSDVASIKRGASFFATNCLSCHTLVYLRYDKLAHEAGITYEKMPINVKNWPNGVTPPDLSLEANVRGVDWVYTYLHSFYQDSTQPMGVNNLLVPNTAMPGIVVPYQGEQVRVEHPIEDWLHHMRWYDVLKLTKQGSMTPEQFDATMTDLVNFLAYAAEPYRAEQHAIGWWVLAFLVVLFVLMYLLKREYWKDVKKHRRE